ncbi:MAG: aromatic ring-hydroxylating dioxygenase subunit alpha [Pseudomonadota bacterium]
MHDPQDKRGIEELISDHRPGFALEQRFYTDPEIYARELERVINRNWFVAGHVSELPEPGDFKRFDAGLESAIIVRGDDGELRALANVCRHRGSRVCLEGNGSGREFACPYHGWIYGLDGSLKAARDMPDGFDAAEYGLKAVSFGVIHGLMLVCFSDDPPDLLNCRTDLARPMAMFGFDTLKVAAREVYEIPANWKLAIENYQECYHCATAHPEYAQLHTLMLDRKKRPRVQSHMRERMQGCGIEDFEIDFIDTAARDGEIGYGYRRMALFKGYDTGSRDGKPVAPLLGELKDYDGGASDLSFGPFSFLLAYSDHVVCYVFTPVDHTNSRCEITWLVRGDAEEGSDYDLDALTWLWDVTTEADKKIIVNNYEGVRSRYYQPGPFAGMEHAEQAWVEWLLAELKRPL